LRLVNLQKDLSQLNEKYDKIFEENLIIPGTIGDFCKFKNMREYIEVRIYLLKIIVKYIGHF